jgi:hypothetical protein
MQIDPKKNYAIITGDFIGFSRLSANQRQAMYFVLKKGGGQLDKAMPGIMPCDVDVFRGDGWQILLTDPVMSLRAALHFRAYIRAHAAEKHVDTRLAIAVGTVDYVPENRVSAGDGKAFRLSGKLLESMTSSKSGSMRFIMDDFPKCATIDGIVRLVGALADGWRPKQALAVTGALQGWTQKQIRELWKNAISHQAVGKHLDRAKWPAVLHGVTVFENALSLFLADGLRE